MYSTPIHNLIPRFLPGFQCYMLKNEPHIKTLLNWEELVDEATQSMLCFPCLGCKTELQMMYAGSKLGLVGEGGFTKVSRACRLMKEKRACNYMYIGTWQNSNLG